MRDYMKKFLSLLLACTLLLSGCNNEKNPDKSSQKVGALTQLNISSQNPNFNHYPNFNSLQMALAAGNIDKIQIYSNVANYMTANNPDFVVSDDQTIKLVDDFCFAMRDDDTNLKNSCDNAIEAMKSDGTLDSLIDKYINNLSETPKPVQSQHFDDADTIKVAITGDLPPFDMILPDGNPAGFNTAVLAELGKRLHKNIQLIQVDTAARAAALVSKQVDIVFWVAIPADNSNRPKNFDTPDGIAVSQPYYQDIIVEIDYANLAASF